MAALGGTITAGWSITRLTLFWTYVLCVMVGVSLHD
jgi:hypothetical protein